MQLKMVFMTEDERKRQQIIMKNKKDMIAKLKADAIYKAELQNLSMKERNAKAQERQPASKGNKLTFGANVVKFEPPKEAKGG